MTVFLDTSVLIALLDEDDNNHDWSVSQLVLGKSDGPAIISDIVYCEASVGFDYQEEVDNAVATLGLERMRCRDDALFRAGKAFLKYRKENAGPKSGVLPDFIIGAIAEAENAPLITLNQKDFAGYFPDIELICPQ